MVATLPVFVVHFGQCWTTRGDCWRRIFIHQTLCGQNF